MKGVAFGFDTAFNETRSNTLYHRGNEVIFGIIAMISLVARIISRYNSNAEHMNQTFDLNLSISMGARGLRTLTSFVNSCWYSMQTTAVVAAFISQPPLAVLGAKERSED